MKKKFLKLVSTVLTVVMLTSLIQLPVFAATPTFRDHSANQGPVTARQHRNWVAPYGDEVSHFDYAVDGNVPAAYYFRPGTSPYDSITVDPDGIAVVNSKFADRTVSQPLFITASTDNFVTSIASGNLKYYSDSPYIHNFDTDPYCISDGNIYDTESSSSTLVFENAALATESNGNKYIVSKDSLNNYIGFRPHGASSSTNGGVMNSTVLVADVKLSADANFDIYSSSKSYSIFNWNASTKVVSVPSTSKSLSSVTPGWHRIKIMFDFNIKDSDNTSPYRANYQRFAVFFDDELLSPVSQMPANLSSSYVIKFEGAEGIDNFKYYGSSTPHAYNVGVTDDTPQAGAGVGGSALMHSIDDFTTDETHFVYSYYVSDTTDPEGTYTKVTSKNLSDPLFITKYNTLWINSNDYEGHFLKVGAKVWNRGGLSPEIMSKKVYEIGYGVVNTPDPDLEAKDDDTNIEPYVAWNPEHYTDSSLIYEKDGKKSVKWGPGKAALETGPVTGELDEYGKPTQGIAMNTGINYPKYKELVVEMYSAKKTDHVFSVLIYDSTGSGFYYSKFPIDWEGEWREIRIPIQGGYSNAGGFSFSGTPTYSPAEGTKLYVSANPLHGDPFYDDTEVYIGRVYFSGDATTINETKPDGSLVYVDCYDPDTMTDYISMVKQRYPNNAHPRLLVTDEIIERINEYKDNDPYMKAAYDSVKKQADAFLTEEETDPVKKSGTGSVTSVNRNHLEDVVETCGIMYLLTKDTKYSDRVWLAVKNIIDNAKTSWVSSSNGTHLDAAHIVNGMALAYDWCYDRLNDDQKREIRNSVMQYGLYPAGLMRNGGSYLGYANNVVAAVSKGYMSACLAFGDEPGYENFSNEFINNIIKFMPTAFLYQFQPDGMYTEGISYWSYAVSSFSYMLTAMETAIGSDGGLGNDYAFSQTGYFPLSIRGPFGSFNFSDAERTSLEYGSSVYFFLDDKYNIPAARAFRLEKLNSITSFEMTDLLWYNPKAETDEEWYSDLKKDFFYHSIEPVVSMRSGYTSDENIAGDSGSRYDNCYFIAGKGGNSLTGHDQYDAGSFVLDALGVRWVEELGSAVYTYEGPSYRRYTERPEGNNCLFVDPGRGWTAGGGQTVAENRLDTMSTILDEGSSDGAAYAVIDNTPSYTETLETYKRGFALVNNRTQFIIRDEFETKSDAAYEVYTYYHLRDSINVTVNADRKSLTLKSGDQVCLVTFESDIPDFEVGVMGAVGHERSNCFKEGEVGYQNFDTPEIVDGKVVNIPYNKVYFHANNVTGGHITAIYTPITKNTSLTMPKIRELADWNEYLSDTTSGEKCNIIVNGITGNKVNITTNGSLTGDKTLILAAYSDGELIDAELIDVELKTTSLAKGTTDFTFDGFNSTGATEVKFFVWENMTTLTPIYKPKK